MIRISPRSLLVILFAFGFYVSAYSTVRGNDAEHSQLNRVDLLPRLVYPRNDTTFSCPPDSLQLRWTTATTFDNSYFVEVGPDSSFVNTVTYDVIVLDTVDMIKLLRADTTLYWRVRTSFDTTEIWKFTIRIPRPLVIVSPIKDTVTTDSVRFVWRTSASSSRYELYVEGLNYAKSDTVNDTTVYKTLPGFRAYTWRVRILCGDGFGEWSQTGSFYYNGGINDVYAESDQPENISVYQSNGTLFVTLSSFDGDDQSLQLSMYNSLGEIISCPVQKHQDIWSVDTSTLPAGLYLLFIRNNILTCSRKILLE